ncbi:mannitol dehydrogenase family protein [Microbacterium sp. K24]|uniref:mannitol dehydrogenase family protein n=1 Tax=Microbacterium sp. K24 TaxID=2305446 RepID=UPI00109C6D82|nr:mannitol dehydrogenase family protein [Microbacterium sp. K24]
MASPLLPLTRSSAAPRPRIAHIGLGAFSRSHQAWYTDLVNTGNHDDPWGITGFTGRTSAVADVLERQSGLYHVVTRGEQGDEITLIESVTAAHDGADLETFSKVIAHPDTALVTLTVSEAGYRHGGGDGLNTAAPAVRDDLEVLASLAGANNQVLADARASVKLSTMPARLALALETRRRAGAGAISLVPCDNLSRNGSILRAVLRDASHALSEDLVSYVDSSVAFVDTSVDRITPATTHADRVLVEERTGYRDAASVVAESFSDWVLSGHFPAGRPLWEAAGARFVDDIEPFERRKLWLLNGAHSLMAYAGLLSGLSAVHEAVRDARLRSWVDSYWNEAAASLPEGLDIAAYTDALLVRFENPRIAHSLRQISAEGSTKVRQRIVPVIFAQREAGRSADASIRAVAAWIAFVMTADSLIDARSDELLSARTGPFDDAVAAIGEIADKRLISDVEVRAQLCSEVRALVSGREVNR